MPQAPEVVQKVPPTGGEEHSAERARKAESARRAANAVSAVAWIPQGDLSEPDWLATGRRLGSIGRGSQWWLGDWLCHGSNRWGDRFTEASRVTGYERGELRTMAWIASQVDASRRNEKLTWDHHVQVARLEPADQEYWLARAEEEGLTVSDLKLELRARRRGEEGGSTAQGADDARDEGGTVCPHCGQRGSAG
jgi:hypothetical protein